MKAYYRECLICVELSEWEYVSFVYNNYPCFADLEQVPFKKAIDIQLLVVFDAFDEICKRIESKSE